MVNLQKPLFLRYGKCVFLTLGLLFCASAARTQGPAPETAPTLFPGGVLISYNSVFVTRGLMAGIPAGIPPNARTTFSHEADFNFRWGFRRDFNLIVLIPMVTNSFRTATTPAVGGTGLGDTLVLVKYRFYRRDSERGTTQASFTVGPKIPTGGTNLTDISGKLLPAGLQPGSGSADLFLSANWTYTGLFNIKRLVADEDLHSLLRSQGTQAMRLGSNLESRFWLSYRPYQSKNIDREWFVGPTFTWLHYQDNRILGANQNGSGGDVLLSGITTYATLRPGTTVWLGLDWDIAHSSGASFRPARRHISFGITKQFQLHAQGKGE